MPGKTPDQYFAEATAWREELDLLRPIVNGTGLTEDFKWNFPCYTWNGKNVVGIGAFKSYFGLWFFNGASLKDERSRLVNAQEGKTKAMRQWRMTSKDDIKPRIIRAYIKEAIALADEAATGAPRSRAAITIPPELTAAMKKDTKIERAFATLRPGQRREYADYIAEAKQAATKARRIAKIRPMILSGVGLNDRYRSKR